MNANDFYNKLTEFHKQINDTMVYHKHINDKLVMINYWGNYHLRKLEEWKQRKNEANINDKELIDNINFNIENCNIFYKYFLGGQII